MSVLYHPVRIGSLELEGNLFLAPLAGWTERVFRSLCVEAGASLTCTELVSSESLTRGAAGAHVLLRRSDNETRYAIQLFGASPEVMGRAASLVLSYQPALIDINAGCPVPKVTRTGAGAALMKDPAQLAAVVRSVVRAAVPVPVSVKIRSGWDNLSLNYLECAQAAVEAGAALVALHARTRSQGYEGRSDWTHIRALAAALPVPVAGSGDLYTAKDAQRMLLETGCAAVMFARGAMGNPGIFSEARVLLLDRSSVRPPDDAACRLGFAFRHLERLAADVGERKASLEMRKVFCAYIKGIPGAAALRNALVRASSIAEYRAACQEHGIPPCAG